MPDISHHIAAQLEQVKAAADSAGFEADFAKSVTSIHAMQITLSSARDHLRLGMGAIDEAIMIVDRISQHDNQET